ncbi:helix-turn-helix transcriptional regulator [Vibrio sonorensis]|uniref:helix-turn-helix transcriptional regulator n=1 Tax=Vibrio sonorensis TaxID=1004316 RepID=UPI0008DA3C45|nr:helix-turn-helix transcriptional regulator [Vibrio sonorensis]
MDNKLVTLFNQLPGYWGCKDLDSVFVYANQSYAELVGLPDSQACIGLTDFDMPSPTTNCAEAFQRQDKYVIKTGKPLKVLDIHPYHDGHSRAHIFTKTPWHDEQGHIQGTIFYGQELTNTAILEVGHWVCRATGLTHSSEKGLRLGQGFGSTHDLSVSLTTRESEVLFLLLYGKKPKQIAEVMGISIKTFESYVMRLRSKFGAHSQAQLIEIALDQGYGSQIPQTLLKTQLSVALNGEVPD